MMKRLPKEPEDESEVVDSEMICPHCRHVIPDDWEIHSNEDGSEGERDCGKCGKTFYWSVHVSISVTTTKEP
jgi:DNA-directed RNA polymerase subunit RPC12/RpoP